MAEWERAPVTTSDGWERAPEAPAAEKPSLLRRAADAAKAGLAFGPFGAAAAAGNAVVQPMIDDAAYNAGGAVTDLATSAGASPKVAAGAGYATNVGVQALPVIAAGPLSKAAGLGETVAAAAPRLMQSALKPPLAAQQSGKAAKAIDTMLKEGISVTEGGAEKLRTQIDALNREIQSAIASSGASIDAGKAGQRVADAAQKAMYSVNAASDLTAIKGALLEFFENPLVQQYGGKLPVQIAQDIKKGSYAALGDRAYGMGLKPAAERDAKKAIVRGLKEEIETAVPGVGPINAKESELINALNLLERRNMMSANRGIAGISLLAHGPKTMGLSLLDRSDAAKSLAARALYSGGDDVAAAATRLGIGGYEALYPKNR